jgi:hypothetical protein
VYYLLIPLLEEFLALMFGDDFGVIVVVCAGNGCTG